VLRGALGAGWGLPLQQRSASSRLLLSLEVRRGSHGKYRA